MTLLRSIVVKNFLPLIGGELAAKGLGFAVSIYLARVVGVEGFGSLGFVFAIYSYLQLLANQGFETVGMREVARGTYPSSEVVSTVVSLRVIFACGASVVLVLFVLLSGLTQELKVLLFLQGLNLLPLAFQLQFLFRGAEQMKYVSASRILQSLLYAGFIFLFVQSPRDLMLVPVFLMASTSVSLVPLIVSYVRRGGALSFTFSHRLSKSMLRASLLLGLSGLMTTIYYNLDSVMLGFMRGLNEVGLYAAAYKIVLLLGVIPNLVLAAFFPILSKPSERLNGAPSLRLFLSCMVVLGAPLGFAGLFFAKWIITVLYGSEYLDAVLPLQILFFNAAAIFFSIAFAHPLIAWNKSAEQFKAVTVGALSNIVLNIILIPRYGLVGAAVATLCSESLVALQASRALRSLTHLTIGGYAGPPLILAGAAFAVTFAITFLMDANDLISLSTFLLLYGIFLWATKPPALRSAVCTVVTLAGPPAAPAQGIEV